MTAQRRHLRLEELRELADLLGVRRDLVQGLSLRPLLSACSDRAREVMFELARLRSATTAPPPMLPPLRLMEDRTALQQLADGDLPEAFEAEKVYLAEPPEGFTVTAFDPGLRHVRRGPG